jgi:hypothetical protein
MGKRDSSNPGSAGEQTKERIKELHFQTSEAITKSAPNSLQILAGGTQLKPHLSGASFGEQLASYLVYSHARRRHGSQLGTTYRFSS